MENRIDNIWDGIKAVIFDLDGTLIDTEKIYSEVWPKTVAEMGYEMTHEMYLSLRSLGRPFAPARFREWYGEAFDYDEARKIRKGHFDAYIKAHGIQRKAGARELVTELRKRGIITAIATATDIKRATEYMEMAGINGLFDKVISATMVDEGKPSPKVYLHACEQLGLKPAECMAVEDAPNGVKSAHAAGCLVVMVPDMSEPDDEIKGQYDICIKSLNEIIPSF